MNACFKCLFFNKWSVFTYYMQFYLYRYAIFMSDLLIKKKHVAIPKNEKKIKEVTN